MWRSASLTLLLAALPAASATSLSVHLGEWVPVNGGRVTFLNVKEDTRCPPRALCFLSAGGVKVKLRVEHGNKVETYLVSLPGQAVPTPLGRLWLKTVTKADRTPTTLTFEVQQN